MKIIIIIMYSFMCYLSKLEHIAHCKAKNQSTVKTNFMRAHMCAYRHTHTHTHTHMYTQSVG